MNADYVAAGTTFPTDYGSASLANISEPISFFLPQQNLVSFASVTDATPGMVITSLDLNGGQLWYSVNSGNTWFEITSASQNSGTVLIDDGNTRLHYEPPANYSSQLTDVFTFEAYDFASSIVSGTSQVVASAGSSSQPVGSYIIDHTMYEGTLGDGGKIKLFSDGIRAAAIHDDGLEILDISNPTSIQRIGITPSESPTIEGLFSDVHIAGSEESVFINPTTASTNGAFVVDLTNQSVPQLLPYNANTFAWTVTSNSDGSMVILGSTGGPEGQSFSNLHFFDTTNRASPQLLSSLNLTIPAATFGTPPFEFTAESDLEVHGITISPDGNTLYVSCLSEMQHQFNVPLFFVVDISNVQQPQVIAQVSKVGFTSDLIFSPSHTLSLDGNTLYVAANEGTYNETGGGGFLAAYDVSNPTSPSQMWKRQFQYGGGFANEVVLDQSTGRIFVAYDGGVRSFAVNQFGVTDEALVSAAGMTNGVAVSADGKHAFVMEQDLLAVYAQNEKFSVSVNIASAPSGPPTDLFLSYTAVGENSQGATVGQLTTTDSEPGDIFTYSLVSGSGSTDNSLFYIEGDYLRVGTNLDYESSDTVCIRIRTTDAQGQYFEKAFVIGVQNYNEPPTDISLSSTTVPEKQSVGTVVGTLTSTDPDGSNFAGFAESFTYSLTIGDGDTDNSSFEIIEDELRTKESFDYGVKNSYSVRIRTEDNMGVPFEKQFLINVATNLNPSFDHISGWTHSGSTVIDFFPVTVSGITAGLGENQPLRITTSSNAEVVSYTSPESTADIIIEIPGAEIYLPGDGGDTYTITVEDGGFDNNLDTASDNGTYSQSFTVTVPSMYEPDPPYDLYLSPASVNENEQDATVGAFYSSSTDPFFDSPWFSLISGSGDTDNGLFYTEGDLLKTNTSFNYETRQIASIRVRAENSVGHHDEVFEITIENVNEAPTDLLLFTPIVVENWPVGSFVDSFSTVDPDVIGAPSGFTYELAQGTGDENNASFEITDGVLRTNEIFDYESKSSYSIRVRTTDSGGLSFEKQFSVTVLNAQNERPILDPSAHPQLQSVIEDAGDPVGQVGTLVSDLIDTEGPLNNFHDDDGDLPGIRIVGTNPQVEDIWFTIDGGAQWNKVNNISRANSLLLFADTQTRIYITGVADYSGALSEAIEFHAWDRTGSHENGARIVYDPVMFSYDTPEHSRWDDIEISPDGKHAFVGTAGIDGSLQVFNIENPLHPVLVSTNNGGNDFSAMILSSDGQYLFHHDDLRLGIIDVSNPVEPSVIASVEHGEGWPTWCLSPDEKYLYKATFDSSVLVIDVQEVTEPVLAGSISLPFFPNILKASADGKYIYASQWNSSVLHVIDITDSVNPIYDYAVNANSNVLDIAVSPDGQYVYVTSEHALEVFQPVPVPEPLPGPGPVPPNNSIGSPYDGVELVPVGELLLGPIRPNYWPYDFRNLSFSEDGKEVYLTDGGAILRIDITNPEIPQIINSWLPVGGSLRSIKPSNDSSFVLATDWDAGFRVVDVTQATPLYGASPGGVVDYSYRPSAAIVDIALNSDGTLMHLATNDGIHLLDDFNQLLSKIDSNEGVNVLEISSNDNFLCYADDTHLRVVDIRDRSNPFETSHIPLSDFFG